LYVLRERPGCKNGVTAGVVSSGLILAGAVLSRYPWRSEDGYVGHSSGVQLLALLSLAMLAASACAVDPSPKRTLFGRESASESRPNVNLDGS